MAIRLGDRRSPPAGDEGLGAADVGAVLALADALTRCDDLESLRHEAVRRVRTLVPCTHAAWNEVDAEHGRMVVVMEPSVPWLDHASEVFLRLAAEHPLIAHHRATGIMTPVKISDLLDVEEYHRLPIYTELYRRLGAEDQMAFVLPAAGDVLVGIALNRARRDFTDRDRLVLNLARPHLAQAYRNVVLRDRANRALAGFEAVIDGAREGLLVVDEAGRVEFVTDAAVHLLSSWYGPDRGAWVAALRRRSVSRAGPGWPSQIDASGERALMRAVALDGGGFAISLSVRPRDVPAEALQPLGLTPRQAEVLALIAAGLTNRDIAQRLDVRLPTVKKHVERIFQLLGVENRTAAATLAMQVGSP